MKNSVEVGAWISIVAYLLLSTFKLIMGFFTDSQALKADDFNNVIDDLASTSVLVGLIGSPKIWKGRCSRNTR